MTIKKKFKLQDALKSFSSDSLSEEIDREIYPPIIKEVIEENKKSLIEAPPRFNKEKFENYFFNESENEDTENAPKSFLEKEFEINNTSESNVLKRNINDKSGQIKSLKSVRKTELENYLENTKSLTDLEHKKVEVEELLDYEKTKNKSIRSKLIKVKADISTFSVNIEKVKSTIINQRVETEAIQSELLRLENSKNELEEKISVFTLENGKLSEQVSLSHRDKNDILIVIQANQDIITDYKKQIVINKENITSIRNEIDYKNKQISSQTEEVGFAKDELANIKKLENNIKQDLIKSELELERENNKFSKISENIQNIKIDISNLESQSVSISDKRRVLTAEFNEYESLYSELIETKKSIENELQVKNEIITKYDSQISQMETKNEKLLKENTGKKELNISRSNEVDKLQKIFKMRTGKIQRLENDNFEYEKMNGVLLSDLEEHKIQNTVLERRLSGLSYDYKCLDNELSLNKQDLEESRVQNEKLDYDISKVSSSRDQIVDNISNIKSQLHKSSMNLEEKSYNLSRVEKDSEKQVSSFTSLKIKRDEVQDQLAFLTNDLSAKNCELKQLIGDRRHVQSQIKDLTLSEIRKNVSATKKNEALSLLKTEKIRLLDSKLSLEEKVNLLTSDISEVDGHIYAENEIVQRTVIEQKEIEERIVELEGYQVELNDNFISLKNKKKELSSLCEKSYIDKRRLESSILRVDRDKSEVENELLSIQEDYGHIDKEYINVKNKYHNKMSVVQELKSQKGKLKDQLTTRKTIIDKKKTELDSISVEEKQITLELTSLNETFSNANSLMISSTMGVKHSRQELKRKRDELELAKAKYISLTSNSKDLQEDHGQQMILIKELDQTKNRYLTLIEELSIKNTNKKAKILEGNQFIETLQKEVETLKENVHLLNNYRKKKAA
ncbi:hypothetical protein A9Q84_02290 [Halobacteriovorax marinus]|uniref:Uncharacterized protein n=1 Tax=Halobacteriovorax marinus TaxID=97084 RepID=A0A1Y5FCR1_9BACT|nr:hypothetical protein A9Q84_02290 [Halobacteriovorax marinus]